MTKLNLWPIPSYLVSFIKIESTHESDHQIRDTVVTLTMDNLETYDTGPNQFLMNS